jgi:tetratricopeptide (TPR) repeat protein
VLRSATTASGGRELTASGDGVLACFDCPSDAVGCAVALQRAFERHNGRGDGRLDVRIGVQVGETSESDEQVVREAALGGAAVEARTLCELALGGQILVSQLVASLARTCDGCSFSPVGLLRLRALQEAVPGFEVVYERSVRRQVPLPSELAARPVGPGLFVGRNGERERLRRVWRRAVQGERQLALVAGEPGIGKTRLAAELACELHCEDAVVLWGRSFEEALVPYQPFVQALRHYVTSCDPDELRSRLPPDAAPLARLLPELALRSPEAVRGAGGEDEGERYRLFEAIASLLSQIAADAPLLLVLDDMQWADQGTLLLLKSIALDPRPAPLLVLATYRDSEVARSHALACVLADVGRDREVELIELGGLADAEVATLGDALLGFGIPAETAHSLWSETRGNPFFLEEVVRQLAELGGTADPEHFRAARATIAGLGVPRRVKELVVRRLERLPPPALRALSVASVVGTEFPLDLLAHVLEEREEQLVSLLDAAVEARLLVESPARIGDYEFSHALIQQALYEEQTANRRAALHARIGEALELLHPEAAAALAHHFSAAGPRSVEKVVTYGRAAGVQALELLAYEDAAREFTRVLAALQTVTPHDLGSRAELLVLLGAAQSRAGDATEASASFAEAAGIARQVGAATTLARAALGYGGGAGFGGVWTKLAQVDETLVGFLEDALATVPAEDLQLRIRLLSRLAEALYWAPDGTRMLALSEQALALARELGDPAALAHALDGRHVALWEPANLEELRQIAEEMLQLGEQAGDLELQLEAYAWLITDALESDPIDVVDRYIAAHARLAEELRQPYHLWYTEVTRAMRAHLDGRFDETAPRIEKAWGHGQTAHAATARQTSLVQQTLLKLNTGELDELVDGLEQAATESPLPAWQAVLALAYAGVDRREEALALVEAFAENGFAGVRRDCVWTTTLGLLARVVGRFDAREYAPPLYRLLLPYADRNCVAGGAILCLGPISRFLGMLARVAGDHERALQHLRQALARSRALGSRSLIARTQFEIAQTLLARGADGDAERADELLQEVEAAAGEVGMPRFAEEVQALRCERPALIGARV